MNFGCLYHCIKIGIGIVKPLINQLAIKIEYQHRELIEASKKGDRQAQYDLYHLYVNAMFNTCVRMVKHEEDAEDIVQEAFVKAFTQLESFKYKSTFGAWMKRIVINQTVNFLNKKKLPLCDFEHVSESAIPEEEVKPKVGFHVEAIQKGMSFAL